MEHRLLVCGFWKVLLAFFVRALTWTSALPLLPAANWQSCGLTARKVGRPSKGRTQEPLALLNGRWPLGDTAPVSVSSITESFMWLMI